MLGVTLPVFGSIVAAVITFVLAPWFARRASAKENERDRVSRLTQRVASAETSQIDRLFREQDQMREQYRQDIADLRTRLVESEGKRDELGKRISVLELEVAEWRAGTRGVAGVWVAVPISVWTYVRDRLPELPQVRFPGEGDDEIPPIAP
jgi:hypothetical protein